MRESKRENEWMNESKQRNYGTKAEMIELLLCNVLSFFPVSLWAQWYYGSPSKPKLMRIRHKIRTVHANDRLRNRLRIGSLERRMVVLADGANGWLVFFPIRVTFQLARVALTLGAVLLLQRQWWWWWFLIVVVVVVSLSRLFGYY